MPWVLIIPGVLLAGGAGLWWLLSGTKVVLYTTVFAEGANIARNYMDDSWSKQSFASTTDLLRKLEGYARIKRLVIIAHGGPDWFFDRSLTPEVLGRVLAPRLAQGAIVGLAGCSAGRGPGESTVWEAEAFGDGGAQSYAGRLRDALALAGGPYLGEVRANTLSGHVTFNPTGRVFAFAAPGEAGRSWASGDWAVWMEAQRGMPAHHWMTGD